MEDTTRRNVIIATGATAGLGLLGGLTAAGADQQDGNEDGENAIATATEREQGTTGADDQGGTDGESARVRVAHLSPDAPAVDVYVDGNAVLEGVEFRTVSDYLELEPGSYSVAVVPSGDDPDAAVIDTTVDVQAADYTVAAVGETAEGSDTPLEPLVLEDDNSPVDDDTSRVRLVHASPDAPAVDVVVAGTDDALFEDLAFGEAQYAEVPGGDYTLEVRPAGQADTVAEVPISVTAGCIYTAFAVGYLDPDAAPADEPFEVLAVRDAGAGEYRETAAVSGG